MVKHTVQVTPHPRELLATTSNPFIGEQSTILHCSMKQYETAMEKYANGALIQHAFYFLNADEREFLISGFTGQQFDEMFREEDGIYSDEVE